MMKFNSKYSGQYYQLHGGDIYTLRGDGRFVYTSVGVTAILYNSNFAYTSAGDEGLVMVQLTGYYRTGADGSAMYQTTSGGWIRMADGWQNTGYAPIRHYSQKDAQYYVNKVLRANASILENNLFCARFASRLTEDQQTTLYLLQSRLESRNKQLLNDGLLQDQKVATPPGYSLLANNLASFMHAYSTGAQIASVGAVATTIVVTAIVIASLATAAYFAYKYMASEAEKDVKYSDELTKILMEKLTPEEYNQLMQETQGIVTKSKLTAKLGGALSLLKLAMLATAGLALYKHLKRN